MKRLKMLGVGKSRRGYTIVEALIFLAVSGALLVSAGVIINGRQERTRFAQAVDDVGLTLQDYFNDVSTGYYPNSNNLLCSGGVLGLTLQTTGSSSTGTNAQCVFSGKLFHFFPTGTAGYTAYTVVSNASATSFASSRSELVGFPPNGGIVDNLPNTVDLQTKKVVLKGNPAITYMSLVIVSDFGNTSGTSLTGNAGRLELYGSTLAPGEILTMGSLPLTLTKIPANASVLICLQQSTDTSRRGVVTITPQLTVERVINQSWDNECN